MNALDPFVDQVLGFVRYRLRAGGDGPPPGDGATIRVLRAAGLCRDLQSRTVRQPLLQGTKYAVAVEGRLLAARGRTDGRVFIGVPEWSGGEGYASPEANCCVCGKGANACVDTAGWANQFGADCPAMSEHCRDGAFLPGHEWSRGELFASPELNCCACGKSSAVAH